MDIVDDMDDWFNEQDDSTLEIINSNEPVNDTDKSTKNSFNENQIESKCIDVDDIIKINPDDHTSHQLIHHLCSVASFVQVLIESSIKAHDTDDILSFEKIQSINDYLSWVSSITKLLAKRIGQEPIPQREKYPPEITRSSYNFCSGHTQCKNFYGYQEKPTCTEHHYVHSLLKNDTDSVVSFLKYVLDNKIQMNYDDITNIRSSIKTICFVSRHMANEISYVDYITKNKSENFHRNNPFQQKKLNINNDRSKNSYGYYNKNNNYVNRNNSRSYRKNNKQTSKPTNKFSILSNY